MPVIKEGATEVGRIEMKRLLTVLLLIILVSIPLQAEKYALLVGINDYQGEISPLRYCVADVEAFSQGAG